MTAVRRLALAAATAYALTRAVDWLVDPYPFHLPPAPQEDRP